MSDKHDDGGPAFACACSLQVQQKGMTLRDWLAGQALSLRWNSKLTPKVQAELSYQIADAMIAQRKREQA